MAFRDRVALTLGELYLQNKDTHKAQAAFREIRFNSPYAAPALLGLGWSYRLENNIRAALLPWLELKNKNTNDPRFQQHHLLIPRQYEVLGASSEALNAYSHTRKIYIGELEEIKTARQIISSERWLQNIATNISANQGNRPLIKSNDIHKKLAENDAILKTIGANRLFGRYASKDFHHWLQQYLQLQALGNYLSLWREQLPIYSEMIYDYQTRQEILHKRVSQTLQQLNNVENT